MSRRIALRLCVLQLTFQIMPSVYDLKPRFQALLRPLMRRLADLGLTPNAVTLAAIVGSIAAGFAVSFAKSRPALLVVLPVWLFVRMALNAIDGMMARELGMSTQLGAVLNELGDAISDLGLYLPLAFVYEPARWPVIAFSIGAILTEFSGVLGRALGASRHYEGPMGKSDRAFVVGALGLATFLFPAIFNTWPWIFAIAALLTALTCLNRVSRALKELRAVAVKN
jgi:phosphatidylglycerophosphate synthase